MQDYKAKYFELFNKLSDAIKILQEVQQETEDLYIKAEKNSST